LKIEPSQGSDYPQHRLPEAEKQYRRELLQQHAEVLVGAACGF